MMLFAHLHTQLGTDKPSLCDILSFLEAYLCHVILISQLRGTSVDKNIGFKVLSFYFMLFVSEFLVTNFVFFCSLVIFSHINKGH